MQNLENGGTESRKFGEVYKNDIKVLDDIDLSQGRICETLNGCIQSVFGTGTTVDLLYQPSITAERVSEIDKFKYQVKFNLNLSVKRNIVDKSTFGERKYIIGNATVKDVICEVQFTPKFSYATPQMKYDVMYTVVGNQYKATYNKILYVYNGKVRSKSVDDVADYNLTLSQITNGTSNNALSALPDEIVVNKILALFTPANIGTIVKNLNNIVNSSSSPDVWTVDNYEVKNSGSADGVWELGASIPSGITPDLISRGKTILDSHVFNVSSNDANLTSSTTTKTFQIKTVTYNTFYENGVLESPTNQRRIAVQSDSAIAEVGAITGSAGNFTLSSFSDGTTYRFLRFKSTSNFVTGVGQECGLDYRKDFTGSATVNLSVSGSDLLVFSQNQNYNPDTYTPANPDTWRWSANLQNITNRNIQGIEYQVEDKDDATIGPRVNSGETTFTFVIDGDQLNSSGVPISNAKYRADDVTTDFTQNRIQFDVSGDNEIARKNDRSINYADENTIAALNRGSEPEQWIGTTGRVNVKVDSLNLDENGHPGTCSLKFDATIANTDCVEILSPYNFLI